MFRRFGQLFRKKMQKVPHVVEKDEKSSIWGKLPSFRANYRVSAFFQLFSKRLQKVVHVVKKHEKSSIWPKLATFRANYRVLAFWSTFQQKVAKSCSFREKARKIIDLGKTSNFSSELPRFGGLVNFLAKSCKRWLISWTGTKNHRFGQNLHVVFWRFAHPVHDNIIITPTTNITFENWVLLFLGVGVYGPPWKGWYVATIM